MENWGIKVKRLREELHITQEDLERKSGIKRSYISRIELGHYPNYSEALITKFAHGLNKTTQELIMYIYGISPTGATEDWEKHAVNPPLKINVYSDYARVHAGEPVEAIDHIYVDRPVTAPFSIKAYRVSGDCLEPELHDGEYVIVDHDRQIDNGDKVVCICNDQLHIAKLKIIGSEYWLENRYATRKMIDCQGIAKVVGSYRKYP